MRFCTDCGAVLNLFGNDEKELCSACIQQQKRLQPSAAPPARSRQDDPSLAMLADSLLSVEGEKLVLRSKEGWELWSSGPKERTPLKTIIERAGRIYSIRLRSQKN